jgi:hypothetical protein
VSVCSSSAQNPKSSNPDLERYRPDFNIHGKCREESVVFCAMKSSAVLIWILFGLYLFGQTTPPSPKLQDTIEKALNGEFMGMEEIKDYEPGKKWFHENSLLIKNGEAVLDKTPVVIVKNKKIYSESDGGFITYRGRFFQNAARNC